MLNRIVDLSLRYKLVAIANLQRCISKIFFLVLIFRCMKNRLAMAGNQVNSFGFYFPLLQRFFYHGCMYLGNMGMEQA